jgi:uncharacterized protein YfiM (DUF2279 family)
MKALFGRIDSAVDWRRLFWVAVVAGIVLALVPAREDAQHWFPHSDKVEHAIAFAVLVGLGWRGRFRSMLRLSIGLVLLGAAIEVAQSFTPTRSAEWGDLFADAAGITLGWCVVTWIERRSRRLPQEYCRHAVVD